METLRVTESHHNPVDYFKLYLDSLSEKELKAYSIAKSHLGMSFQLEKSIGFIKWKSQYVPIN